MTHLSVEGTNASGEKINDTAYSEKIIDGKSWYGYFSMEVPACEEPEDPEEPEEPEQPEDDNEEVIVDEDIPNDIPEISEEEIIIIEELIPQGVPEVEAEEIDMEEEIIEIVEAVPLGSPTLPATGATSDYIYYGFGSIMLAIGEFIRRKKK